MPLRLPREAVYAIRSLLDFGEEKIIGITQFLGESKPSLAPTEIRALQISEGLNDSTLIPSLETILSEFVYPVHDLRHALELSPDDLFLTLSESLSTLKPEQWPAEYAKKWERTREAIIRLFANSLLQREAKAKSLLAMRPNRVQKLSIFTDVRPVFDDPGHELYFDIVTNTLCLEYMSNGSISTMYFSLDSRNLKELQLQLERARSKGRLISELHSKLGLPALEVEENDPDQDSVEGSA
ncbi:hypothetical protein AB1L88_11670 [Tautonia sp. JC769]|uniref:hypothetical protein n=1 Tax=Tautonia sp. JC769 TaxID=3232135 RepID=UPI003459AF43